MAQNLDSRPFKLRCTHCSSEFGHYSNVRTCSECGGRLEVDYDYGALESRTEGKSIPSVNGTDGIWCFSPLLPLTDKTRVIVSLGEGGTPLRKLEYVGNGNRMKDLFIKDESRNPTLSFKDRKSTTAITKAVEHAFGKVACATAGNAGSSVAAYAARAGLGAYVFVFKGISESKLAKLLSYGARVFETDGSTRSVVEFVEEICKRYGILHLSAQSRYDPYTKEGAKTAIFEIFEQMGNTLPDWILVPLGTGGNIAAYFKGMVELRKIGLIEEYSKLVGVQGKYCSPVVEAFDKGLAPEQIPTAKNAQTIAHSILDDWPPDGDQALIAIRETKGLAIAVSDDEIIQAMKMLSTREGMFLEPASVAPLAALLTLLKRGTIDRDEKVVMIGTGSGLNQPDVTLSLSERPTRIDLKVQDFQRYMR